MNIITVLLKLITIFIGLCGFGLLVAIHEFGHFLFCKLFAIRTPSFSIGYGPTLISKKIGDTLFSLSLLPFGGYVEIAGNEEVGQGEQLHAHDNDEGSFKNKKLYQKLLVMGGGIIANIGLCYIILLIVFLIGAPASPWLSPYTTSNIIEKVNTLKDPELLLMAGDVIKKIDSVDVSTQPQTIVTLIKKSPCQTFMFEVERASIPLSLPVTVHACSCKPDASGYLDISLKAQAITSLPLGHALYASWTVMSHLAFTIFRSIKMMCERVTLQGAGGPLLILTEGIKTAESGFLLFTLLIAFLSVNLAIVNLIPLPILDGGQMLTLIIESIIGKELPEKTRMVVHLVCWGLMILLMLYLTYQDILALIPTIKGWFIHA